jgi:hypothetical protein
LLKPTLVDATRRPVIVIELLPEIPGSAHLVGGGADCAEAERSKVTHCQIGTLSQGEI